VYTRNAVDLNGSVTCTCIREVRTIDQRTETNSSIRAITNLGDSHIDRRLERDIPENVAFSIRGTCDEGIWLRIRRTWLLLPARIVHGNVRHHLRNHRDSKRSNALQATKATPDLGSSDTDLLHSQHIRRHGRVPSRPRPRNRRRSTGDRMEAPNNKLKQFH
jgi:hypothetical protein